MRHDKSCRDRSRKSKRTNYVQAAEQADAVPNMGHEGNHRINVVFSNRYRAVAVGGAARVEVGLAERALAAVQIHLGTSTTAETQNQSER